MHSPFEDHLWHAPPICGMHPLFGQCTPHLPLQLTRWCLLVDQLCLIISELQKVHFWLFYFEINSNFICQFLEGTKNAIFEIWYWRFGVTWLAKTYLTWHLSRQYVLVSHAELCKPTVHWYKIFILVTHSVFHTDLSNISQDIIFFFWHTSFMREL